MIQNSAKGLATAVEEQSRTQTLHTKRKQGVYGHNYYERCLYEETETFDPPKWIVIAGVEGNITGDLRIEVIFEMTQVAIQGSLHIVEESNLGHGPMPQ